MSSGRVRGVDAYLREMIVVRVVRTRKGDIDLPHREAREAEIEVHVGEIAKLQLQEIEIPARTERDLVVGQSQRALLPIGQSCEHNGRNLRETRLICGSQPPVPRDDDALFIDQDRG